MCDDEAKKAHEHIRNRVEMGEDSVTWFSGLSSDEKNVTLRRSKRFLPILSLGASLLGLVNGVYIDIEIGKLKAQEDMLRQHVNAISGEVTSTHDSLVTVMRTQGELYEFTNAEFRKLSSAIQSTMCEMEEESEGNLASVNRAIAYGKKYTDMSVSLLSVFSQRANPVLLPMKTLSELMRKKRALFTDTIFAEMPELI